MELDLGAVDRIVNPTSEDVAHYLRFMPVQSPFVVLSRDDATFIQAVFEARASRYRVEYKCDGVTGFILADYRTAIDLFLCYMDEQCELAEQAKWKRLTVWNTPGHPLAIGIACTLLFVLIILGLGVGLGLF